MRFAEARALIAAGRPDEAAESLAEAISRARGMSARGLLWRYLGTLAALEDERGNHDAAESLRAEAEAEFEYVAANTWPDALRAAFRNRVFRKKLGF
jgi:hypothetical protein